MSKNQDSWHGRREMQRHHIKSLVVLNLNCRYQNDFILFFSSAPLKGLETMTNPEAMNTPMLLKIPFTTKRNQVLCWTDQFYTEAENRKCPRWAWNIWKIRNQGSRAMSKELKSQFKEVQMAKDRTICTSKKITCNGVNHIKCLNPSVHKDSLKSELFITGWNQWTNSLL